MAVLSTADRAALWADAMREMSALGASCSITKADLRAALDAADVWADSNAASYNAALPQPARTALSARQKARLLAYVIMRRYEVTP
jgi:hypothetical protein